MASDQAPRDADVVFVPAHPVLAGGHKDVGFETRRLQTGEQAAIAFTSLERLVGALGRSQPWLAMRLGNFRQVMGASGVNKVAVDPEVPDDAWRWKAADLEEIEKQ